MWCVFYIIRGNPCGGLSIARAYPCGVDFLLLGLTHIVWIFYHKGLTMWWIFYH